MDLVLVKQRMQNSLTELIADIASIRTGRAAPALVEGIEVSVYGGTSRMRIRELASITCPDPGLIIIDPWDKSIVGEVRKGILEANVGFNPSIDAQNALRIALPPMTGEDREKYIKLVSSKLEGARVMIRQIRGDAMQDIKKAFEAKEVTEDEKRAQEKKIQEATDEFIQKIDHAGEAKKKELLQI